MRKAITLAVCAMALAGCDPVGIGLATTGLSLASLNMTKKTLSDHIVSAAIEKDCSVLNLERSGHYCPTPPKPVDRSKLYCYRTLADVDCHAIPDPYRNGARPVTDPPLPPAADDLKPVPHMPGAPLGPMVEGPEAPTIIQLSQR